MDREIQTAALRYAWRRWWANARFGQHKAAGSFQTPGPTKGFQLHERGITVTATRGAIRLTAIAPDCVQVRFQPEGRFAVPFSYAVAKVTWPEVKFTTAETDEAIVFSLPELTCQINRADCTLKFLDRQGRMIAGDAEPLRWREGEFQVSRTLAAQERILGLAPQPVGLDLRGKRYFFWNTDPVGTARGKLPTYFTIPFYIGAGTDFASGLFWDNPSRGWIDVGAESPDRVTLCASLGELRYYQFAGNTIDAVLQRYTELTGRMSMPPLWALGFHLSRWSYTPADRVREIAAELRRRHIPCDVLYLDIDYMDGYRCFTWSPERFPAPAVLLGQLADQGFKTVVILDPGIKRDPQYSTYQSGLREDVFLKYPNGRHFVGPVWAADSVFPDFSKPAARLWWRAQMEAVLKPGAAGVWNDMNEPVIFSAGKKKEMPDSVRHDNEGAGSSHVELHNLYGTLMARASREGLEKAFPDKRPFNMVRAGYAGVQRYASGWTGDNVSDWDHLRLAITMSINSGLSGMAFTGPDVGGFFGDCEPELFARFMALGCMMPYFRVHTAMGTRNQEPWAFGEEVEAIARRFIELRYRLLPYFYSLFAQNAQHGTPILRPLFMADPSDPALWEVEDAFLVGDSLLAAPVLEPKQTERTVYLPAGKWYNFFTGEAFIGGKSVTVPAPLDTLPLFVRAGHVIPLWEVQQHVGQTPVKELQLNMYYGDAEITLYEDAGEGLEYQRGDYRWLYFTTKTTSSGGFQISWRRAGRYEPTYERVRCQIYGLPQEPAEVRIDNAAAPLWYYEHGVIEFAASRVFENVRLTVSAPPAPDVTLSRSPLRDEE